MDTNNKKLWIAGCLTIIISISIYFNISNDNESIESKLKNKATKTYLQEKISLSLKEGNLNEAILYKNLALHLDVKIDQNLLDEFDKKNDFFFSFIRNIKDFIYGFSKGEADNVASLSGSIVSDFTLVGDVRDMYKEGNKMSKNEDYDKLILSISTIGVALSVSSYLTLGLSAPLKIGASIIKVAKKSNKLSALFIKNITSKINKTIDTSLLKNIKWTSLKSIKDSTSTFYKNINIQPIKKVFTSISKIKKNTSNIDTINLIKYVDNEKDLVKMTKISDKFKGNTVAVFKVLGKGALKGSKLFIKYIYIFIFQIISLLLFVLYLLYRLIKKLANL